MGNTNTKQKNGSFTDIASDNVTLPTPTRVRTENIRNTYLTLTWDIKSSKVESFIIEQRKLGLINFDEIAEVDGKKRDLTVTHLEQGTTYEFRVKAKKGSKCSEFAVLQTPVTTSGQPAAKSSPSNEGKTLKPPSTSNEGSSDRPDGTSNEGRSDKPNELPPIPKRTGVSPKPTAVPRKPAAIPPKPGPLPPKPKPAPNKPSSTLPKPEDVETLKVRYTCFDLSWKYTGDVDTFAIEKVQVSMDDYTAASYEFETVATVKGNSRHYKVTGLDVGTNYKFRIKAQRESVSSEYVYMDVFTISDPTPETPRNLSIEQLSPTFIELSWTEGIYRHPEENFEKYFSYIIEISTLYELDFKECGKVDGNIFKYRITDLNPETDYQMRVKEVSTTSESPWSEELKGRTLAQTLTEKVGIPSPPQNITKEQVGPTFIKISWQNAYDDTLAEKYTKYKIQHREIPLFVFDDSGTVDGGINEFMIQQLKPKTKYEIRIAEENFRGISDWSYMEKHITTENIDQPSKPENVNVKPSDISDTTITVMWTNAYADEISEACTTHVVQHRETSSQEWKESGSVGRGLAKFVIRYLQPNTVYDIRVRGENAAGISEWERILKPVQTKPSIKAFGYENQTSEIGKGDTVKAKYSFEAREKEDLAFEKNDLILITMIPKKYDQWLYGEHLKTNKKGFMPKNYVVLATETDEDDCPILDIDRDNATKIVKGMPRGSFVLRYNSERKHPVLTVHVEKRIKHIVIRLSDDSTEYFIVEEYKFKSIADLIAHLKETRSTKVGCKLTEQYTEKSKTFSLRELQMDRTNIQQLDAIGRGHFGEVFRAQIVGGSEMALKILTKEGDTNMEEFLKEATLMHKLDHPNIVKLLGVSTTTRPFWLLIELMKNGSLLSFLKKDDDDNISLWNMLQMSLEITKGMSYLEDNKVIHRDLRASNVLVDEFQVCKVADFGLSLKGTTQRIKVFPTPVIWAAPEVLEQTESDAYSTKSDVWAFGIVMFEILTKGGNPYGGLPNSKVKKFVLEGRRLNAPTMFNYMQSLNKSREYWTYMCLLMKDCWAEDPDNRPSFKTLQHKCLTLVDEMRHDGLANERIRMTLAVYGDRDDDSNLYFDEYGDY